MGVEEGVGRKARQPVRKLLQRSRQKQGPEQTRGHKDTGERTKSGVVKGTEFIGL